MGLDEATRVWPTLMHDRDSFSRELTQFRSPNMNAFVERFVQLIARDTWNVIAGSTWHIISRNDRIRAATMRY